MTGGKYIACERGAFDQAGHASALEQGLATAPLFEFAAVHDGQPPMEWLSFFIAWCRGVEA